MCFYYTSTDFMCFYYTSIAVVPVVHLPEVLEVAELSQIVASSMIPLLAHSPTLRQPPLPQNILLLKREHHVQPMSRSPRLGTAPLLMHTPPPPLTPQQGTRPPVQLTPTLLTPHHNLMIRFVAREQLEQHTHREEVELMRCRKEAVLMNLCLDSEVVLDQLGIPIRSLVHLPSQARHLQ